MEILWKGTISEQFQANGQKLWKLYLQKNFLIRKLGGIAVFSTVLGSENANKKDQNIDSDENDYNEETEKDHQNLVNILLNIVVLNFKNTEQNCKEKKDIN